jgi:hypothetical protein
MSQVEQPERYLRRVEAAKRLREIHNQPYTDRTLAKIACTRSDGPPFLLAGRFPLYPISELDKWARSKMGPLVRSTSEARSASRSQSEKKIRQGEPSPQDQFARQNLAERDLKPTRPPPLSAVAAAASQPAR